MGLRHGERVLDMIPFEANGRMSTPIPRDKLIKSISLNFDADLVVTDPGGGAAGVVLEDSTLRLMPQIEVYGNGSILQHRSFARGLYYKNMYENGTLNHVLDPTAGAVNTYPIDVELEISFENNIGLVPADSFLNAPAFNSLTLFIKWGDPSDCFDAAHTMDDAIAASFGVTPVVHETTEPVAKLTRITDWLQYEVTATRPRFPIDLMDRVDRLYQAFVFMTRDTDCKENDIINEIDLQTSKGRHIEGLPFIQLQRMNKRECGLETIQDGLAYLNLLEHGRIPSGLQVLDVESAKLLLDVTVGTGETMIDVLTDQIVPF